MIFYIISIIIYFTFQNPSINMLNYFGDFVNRFLNIYILYSTTYFSYQAYILYKKFFILNNNLIPKLIWRDNFNQNPNNITFNNLKNLHQFICTFIVELNDLYGFNHIYVIYYSAIEIMLNLYYVKLYYDIIYLITSCSIILNFITMCRFFHICCAEVVNIFNLFFI